MGCVAAITGVVTYLSYQSDIRAARDRVIVGVSAGAPSSLQFALCYPERTSLLLLIVPGVYTPKSLLKAQTRRLYHSYLVGYLNQIFHSGLQ